MKPVIAFIDIETSPIRGYTWGMYEQNVIKIDQHWNLLSFAVKYGDKTTNVLTGTDEELTKYLWDVFDRSDIIVAHNGDSFDIKKANAKFIQYGLTPPSPYKKVDTLKIARKYFKFESNKLDDLGELLGVGRKMKHAGIDMWFAVMDGDEKALKMMARYNKQDVELLYNVYQKLKSWDESRPNMNIFSEIDGCPTCGSSNIQSRGFSITKTGKKKRFQCQDCGSWCSGSIQKVTNVS